MKNSKTAHQPLVIGFLNGGGLVRRVRAGTPLGAFKNELEDLYDDFHTRRGVERRR